MITLLIHNYFNQEYLLSIINLRQTKQKKKQVGMQNQYYFTINQLYCLAYQCLKFFKNIINNNNKNKNSLQNKMKQVEINSNTFQQNHNNLIQLFLEYYEQYLVQGQKFPQQNSSYSTMSETTYNCDNNSQLTILDIPCQQNYFSQRQNQIKNLLNSFKNHITETQDEFLMNRYCQLYQSQGINYTNLKKIVTKRIKDKNTRWNMKLKSLLKSIHLRQIFYYYLENESMKWLNNSKVQDRELIIELVERLIQYQHNDKILKEIRTYRK
ncbi:hypothetical protein TTHERM_00755840 (macronuclear) [Tetrahymena thermophila SB210]|uniref:Uncharacterized protein n=1 Tax=Tetrahymena thermophila (strain SB210) TaxID=312017 RepID=I7LZJ5_TETTS|nr:hypothetical protein TTHERM_00755840 [Tetrahymena thermophila SB210]EAR84050.2 hypothetical protein TTHERM_00755840 [Tetrahymena thermophila SB210]|eukprot:XP_001031713.2 hypothetical protein TTHERM_00755840 [Tetrahymena thermophila SB210]